MKKSSIPMLATGSPDLDRFASSVKQNLDSITGQARNTVRLDPLPANATTAQVIARLNEIVARLQ